MVNSYQKFLYMCIKMVNKYYKKNKEKLQKEARERYQNLSEEEKEKRRKKASGRYENLSEENEKRQYHRDQVEYMKNYYLAHKKE